MHTTTRIAFWAFLLTGLAGAASLSYTTFQGINPCPIVFSVRACYVVFVAYFLMTIAQTLKKQAPAHRLFWGAWLIAFGFAIYGSTLELFQGDICPKNNPGPPFFALPMCYISLIFCAIIAGTWLILHKRR
ncbi:MAG: hypothetical protein AAF564_16775 [Bacteroidota bacterium]